MRLLNNEKGAILITMILLMVIVTLIGVIAINTATVDIQISGNLKKVSTAFAGAEAGIELSIPIIENTIANGALTPSAPIGVITGLDTANLDDEITGGMDNDADFPAGTGALGPDISLSKLGKVKIDADIDRLYSVAVGGGSLEFASGYEGIGAGAAGGGVGVLYKVDSVGTM